MADDVTFQDAILATPPTATKVATDDVSGAHHQKVKVEFGADGTATQVSATDPLPVDVTGTVTVTTDGLTDAELRATPVPVSGPLTDAQLRALAVPVSLASAPLATGAATEAKQDSEITKLAGGLPAALAAAGGLKVEGVAGGVAQPVSAASLPLPSGAATAALQGGGLPSALATDRLKVDGSGVTQPVAAAALPLPTGAATAALQTQPGVDIGDVTVNNGAAGAAVNVQDGGNSITVDSSIKSVYGAEAQAVTCTLTSLASSATAGREGLVVSNLSDLFLDVMVFAQIALTTGTPGNDKRVYIWAYGTVDAATPIYPDTITGADAAITFNSPINLRLLGIIEAPAQSTTYKAGPWSLAQLFGSVPEKWGIAVQNYTGIAFTATAGNHKVLYQGVSGKLV